MENSLVSWRRKLGLGLVLTLVLILGLATAVYAAIGDVSNLSGTATDTTVDLLWTVAPSSNTTVIRYSTSTYPATPAAGTSAYSGTSYYTTVSGLTAGATYYFSAWGYDGSNYSSTAAQLVITTGGISSANNTIPMTNPTLPASVFQDPDTSGWSIAPFDYIASYFSTNGLAMPVNSFWMMVVSLIVTFIAIGTYIKWRSFFTSWTIAFILSLFFVSAHVMQGLVIIIELGIGIGVAAIERYYQ